MMPIVTKIVQIHKKYFGISREWTDFIKFIQKNRYFIKSNLDRKLNKIMKNTFFRKVRFPKGSPGSPGIVYDGSYTERSPKITLKVRATDTKI